MDPLADASGSHSEEEDSPHSSPASHSETQSGASPIKNSACLSSVMAPVRLTAETLVSGSNLLGTPGRKQGGGSSIAGAGADASMCATDGGDCEIESSVGGPCCSTHGLGEHRGNRLGVDESDTLRGVSEGEIFEEADASGKGEGEPAADDVAEAGMRGKAQWSLEGESEWAGKKKRDDREEGKLAARVRSLEGCKPILVSISAADRDRLLLDTGVSLEEAEERWWKGFFQDHEAVTQLAKIGVCSLADWVQHAAVDGGEHPFLICPETKASLSYRSVNERSNAVAVWAHKDRRGIGTLEASLREGVKKLDVNPAATETASPRARAEHANERDKGVKTARESRPQRDAEHVALERLEGQRRKDSWEMVPSPAESRSAGSAKDCSDDGGMVNRSVTGDISPERAPLQEGSVVALFMSTKIESIIVLLGLLKASLVVALIPSHLRGHKLFQALAAAKPTSVFVDGETLLALRELYDMPEQDEGHAARAAAFAETVEGEKEREPGQSTGGKTTRSLWEKTFVPVWCGGEGNGKAEKQARRAGVDSDAFPVFVYGEAPLTERCPANTRERNLIAEIRKAICACVACVGSPLELGCSDVPVSPVEDTLRCDASGFQLSSPGAAGRRRHSSLNGLLLPPCSPSLGVVFNLPSRTSVSAPLCWACLEPGDAEVSRIADTNDALVASERARARQAPPAAIWGGGNSRAPYSCAVCGQVGEGEKCIIRPALYAYVSVPSPSTVGVEECRGGYDSEGTHSGSVRKVNQRLEPVKLSDKTVMRFGITWARHMDLAAKDVVYCPLDIQEESGGLAIFAAVVQARASLVLPRRVPPSATAFWTDIDQFKCTYTAYCPAMLKTLFSEPRPQQGSDQDDRSTVAARSSGAAGTASPSPSRHLRGCVGHGMTCFFWSRLKQKAGENLKVCVEHYYRPHWPISSPLINSLGKMGPCGFIPNTVQGERGTARLARFDEPKQEIVRGPHTGLCLDAELRSTDDQRRGEAIVSLAGREEWLGFVNDDVTRAMVYRNAFRQGDAWCRSGDLMSVDRLGFFYFLSRIGRWKSQQNDAGAE
ncbi:hypothetical protein BESB_061810 [Besnoitia besnoiti]|uniref:Uncharacterized protein n=1 Tax=Besnoitia besnoiti TaxID=94643 RepID=A0A2A9MDL8_BESBE|nr:hypothetical protein BESB_061810 [Besnoitia besnoiti]PFH35294.1 hypothetical protein BESB_061810 [Besnoitia besnoiti]